MLAVDLMHQHREPVTTSNTLKHLFLFSSSFYLCGGGGHHAVS
jgi:hypothetical protein